MLSPPRRRADELGDPRPLVVLVQRNERTLEAEFPEQSAAVTRVLGRDRADTRENLARSRRNVAHVADWRRDDIEHARPCHYKMSFPDRTCHDCRGAAG